MLGIKMRSELVLGAILSICICTAQSALANGPAGVSFTGFGSRCGQLPGDEVGDHVAKHILEKDAIADAAQEIGVQAMMYALYNGVTFEPEVQTKILERNETVFAWGCCVDVTIAKTYYFKSFTTSGIPTPSPSSGPQPW